MDRTPRGQTAWVTLLGVLRIVGDLLVPHRCLGCGMWRRAPGVCAACATDLVGLALGSDGHVQLAPEVRAVGAYAYDGVAAEAVRSIKVRGAWAGGPVLGVLARGRWRLPPPGPRLAWTWVPAAPHRRRRRGFDLPELLAGPDAVPLLARVRQGPDQTERGAAERRRGLQGAFAPVARCPPAVVCVDDVRTTGATARAAAAALLDGGARRIIIATFAVGGTEARRSIRIPRR